ncbi:hypothetical protein CERZMDRAFT_38615 [Cercospora zeae-maydis SCOH1-5]|uniref:Uncharacterized protein n=1 Tax=Cercospora zeae-maydis SCOH1-5 TaxID=717836 RepID=A0A6A6FL33_9PEZI|nr:hypothetical protein CERZMDRAFT_38615 [Cercospora zeae-maydis SCOH1-5]
MPNYALSIVVYGLGTDPNHRSHWAFAIHEIGAGVGALLHVSLLDLQRLIYQFDSRRDVVIRSRSSEGSFVVGLLRQEQVRQAIEIISGEPAPRDGVERCQDWVLRAVISLEAEEIVAPGTSNMISSLVGKPARVVAQAVGRRWTKTTE